MGAVATGEAVSVVLLRRLDASRVGVGARLRLRAFLVEAEQPG